MDKKEIETFAKNLTPEDKLLLILREELYESSWDLFLKDLNNRKKGKPYIFKLMKRIEEDIERIERLKKFEEEHNVNLFKYLKEMQ
jgi:S-adenosylmethionine:tRNA-ribosyltransferase-isomerase (queuine synthetase)